ncbi:HlyD family secretion protein [Indiicoccus explosivorum]|uniref:HlyD family secretion protein n=1 Tax=Indiicoccus explosivorum TaxID=1917864 RepID=UPI000B4459FD|nr:HlyD family secretion protein [Indiicoccus explosivorum]
MNKFLKATLIVTVLAFIAINAILMFGEKSVLIKRVYVHEYAQTFAEDYSKTLAKEALTVPGSELTISAAGTESVEQWLVDAGDRVEIGAELAVLDAAEAENQRAIWEAELKALKEEREEVEGALDDLEDELDDQDSSTTATETTRQNDDDDDDSTDDDDSDSEEAGDINVNVEVQVPQTGAFSAGIAQLEQQLAAIERQIDVVEAQLDQEFGEAVLLSPVDGVVGGVDPALASVTIYSQDREFRTFVTEDQWQELAVGDEVFVQAAGLAEALPATIASISEVPAESDEWFHAYRVLSPETPDNPIAFYAVDVQLATPDAAAEADAEEPAVDPVTAAAALPFGSTANAAITLDEAEDAVALPENWLVGRSEGAGFVFALTPEGYAAPVPVTVAFDLHGRTVLAEGLPPGVTALRDSELTEYLSPPAVFMPFPLESPDWEQAKEIPWRAYIPFLFGRTE